MKKFAFLLSALLPLAGGLQAAVTGNINLLGVTKSMDEDDWDRVDIQNGVGLSVDIKEASWPVSVVLGFQSTSASVENGGGTLKGMSNEVDLGMKFIWGEEGRVHPFLAGGVSSIRAQAEGGTGKHSDDSLGRWLSAGVYATMAGHVNLGLFYRISAANVRINGSDVDAGGRSFGWLLGYHF